ncbi:hypothetical protein H0H92_004122 [Tricholoma furcatifolium]|nr:hypothetical protein H0H92_004122 [Tricholoma furcatifolium]
MSSLDTQCAVRATATDKIQHAILATAIVDALGGPAEFHKRFTFSLVTDMIPNRNFSLSPGVWTDDTSMTLCLARSIATFSPSPSADEHVTRGGFDEKHQLDAYCAWYNQGTLSAIDHCFDIGGTVRNALDIYEGSNRDIKIALRRIDARLNEEECSGNGSLMRVLPIGLAYWRDEDLAREYARKSSTTTHPNGICQEACDVWTQAVVRIMSASTSKEAPKYTKLDLLKVFADFPYSNRKLRDALAFPKGTPPLPMLKEEQEKHFYEYHPLLRLITRTQDKKIDHGTGSFDRVIPSISDLPSTGYVLHTLVAALYCFLVTESFEEGAIMAVNLGDDADTVGAIYAGMAGCWYAGSSGEPSKFWTKKVIEWATKLVRRDLVENVAAELASFSAKLGD